MCLLPDFETLVMVDEHDDAIQPSEKMERVMQAGDDFRNGFPRGFWVVYDGSARSPDNRSFSSRITATPWGTLRLTYRASRCTISRPSHRLCAQSQRACVGRPLPSQLTCARKRP